MKRLLLLSGLLSMAALTYADVDGPYRPAFTQSKVYKFAWSNADVVALGASATGELTVATIPDATIVTAVYVRITGQAAGVTTLTVSVGPDGAETTYIVASNAKAAAGTIYGDAAAEIGTTLIVATGAGPSFGSTTTIKALFTATIETLDATTGSAGSIWVVTRKLP